MLLTVFVSTCQSSLTTSGEIRDELLITTPVSFCLCQIVRRHLCCIRDLIHPSNMGSYSLPFAFTHSCHYLLINPVTFYTKDVFKISAKILPYLWI